MSASEAGVLPERKTANTLSPWCHCRLKRALDLIGSSILLVAASPAMVIVALIVKRTSPGPALFRQKRVGKDGRAFELLKFRTMLDARQLSGPGITRRHDPRITRVGAWLRKCKIDELPQLLNVVRGEMSLVGPRPDLPKYFEGLRGEQRLILSLTPGVTGAASLRFCDEEALLAQVEPAELESFYVNTLLPQKIELELDYARGANIFTDAAMLFRTAAALVH